MSNTINSENISKKIGQLEYLTSKSGLEKVVNTVNVLYSYTDPDTNVTVNRFQQYFLGAPSAQSYVDWDSLTPDIVNGWIAEEESELMPEIITGLQDQLQDQLNPPTGQGLPW